MNRWGLGAAAISTLSAMILPLRGSRPEQSTGRVDQTYSSTVQAEAKRSATDFSPDGGLSADVWKNAEWVAFDHDLAGKSQYPGALTSVAAAWTDDSIYFFFRCRFDSLNVY